MVEDEPTDFVWSSIAGATAYDLQFDSDAPIEVSETTWNLVSDALGEHSWKVRGKNEWGDGPWSAEWTFSIVPLERPLTREAAMFVVPCLIGNIDADIPAIIGKASANGFDKIYIQVFESTAPQAGRFMIVDETNGSMPGSSLDYVTLSTLVEQAHASGIQVIGVLACFPDTTCSGDATDVSPDTPSHSSYLVDSVIDYLLYSFDEEGRDIYDLDGIGLDYVRYAGPPAVSSNVTAFVTSARMKCVKTDLHAFIACWPDLVEQGSPYTGNWKSYTALVDAADTQVGQNWPDLAAHLDYAVAMTFAAEGGVYDLQLIEEYADTTLSMLDSAIVVSGNLECRAISGVQTWDARENPDCTGDVVSMTTPASIRASIMGGVAGKADGYFSFRYATAVPDYGACFVYSSPEDWWAELQAFNTPAGDLPIGVISAGQDGGEVTFDAGGSHDGQTPAGALEVRWDWEYEEGSLDWDTGWSTDKVTSHTYSDGHQGIAAVEIRDQHGHSDIAIVHLDIDASAIHLVEEPGTVREVYLSQGVPSPFGSTTRVEFGQPAAGRISLEIFDLMGRVVRTMFRGELLGAGRYSVTWDGRDSSGELVSQGMYFYRLNAGHRSLQRRLVFLR
ncbi:MAG: hypothetical protein KAY32_17435 [Candidatus Eisenbacteria sp.]|nr:hypothetical protein [Candidatus Eisenbacteria bacterium]